MPHPVPQPRAGAIQGVPAVCRVRPVAVRFSRLHAYDQDDDGRDGGADEGPALDRTG